MAGELSAEMVDFRQNIRQVHHMAHGETRVDLAHRRPSDQPRRRLHRVLQTPARQDVEIVLAAHRLGEKLGGEDLLLAPDHAVLQCRVDLVLGVEALVHHLDIVHQADEHVGLELGDLVEVDRREQPMAPAKGGVGVDDDIPVVLRWLGRRDDILKRSPSEGRQSGDRQIENPARAHIRRLRVHQVAEIKELDVVAAPPRSFLHRPKVGLLVDSNLAGDDRAHADISNFSRQNGGLDGRA